MNRYKPQAILGKNKQAIKLFGQYVLSYEDLIHKTSLIVKVHLAELIKAKSRIDAEVLSRIKDTIDMLEMAFKDTFIQYEDGHLEHILSLVYHDFCNMVLSTCCKDDLVYLANSEKIKYTPYQNEDLFVIRVSNENNVAYNEFLTSCGYNRNQTPWPFDPSAVYLHGALYLLPERHLNFLFVCFGESVKITLRICEIEAVKDLLTLHAKRLLVPC